MEQATHPPPTLSPERQHILNTCWVNTCSHPTRRCKVTAQTRSILSRVELPNSVMSNLQLHRSINRDNSIFTCPNKTGSKIGHCKAIRSKHYLLARIDELPGCENEPPHSKRACTVEYRSRLTNQCIARRRNEAEAEQADDEDDDEEEAGIEEDAEDENEENTDENEENGETEEEVHEESLENEEIVENVSQESAPTQPQSDLPPTTIAPPSTPTSTPTTTVQIPDLQTPDLLSPQHSAEENNLPDSEEEWAAEDEFIERLVEEAEEKERKEKEIEAIRKSDLLLEIEKLKLDLQNKNRKLMAVDDAVKDLLTVLQCCICFEPVGIARTCGKCDALVCTKCMPHIANYTGVPDNCPACRHASNLDREPWKLARIVNNTAEITIRLNSALMD